MHNTLSLVMIYGKNIFLSILFFSFIRNCMSYKETVKHHTWISVFAEIVLFSVLTLFDHFPSTAPAGLMAAISVLFLFSFLYFDGKIFKKCFLSVLPACAALTGTCLTAGLISFFTGSDFKTILTLQSSYTFLFILLSCVSVYLLVSNAGKIYGMKAIPLEAAEQNLMFTVTGSSMGILFLLFWVIRTSLSHSALLPMCIAIIALCLLNSAAHRILMQMNKGNRETFEETLIRQQNSNQLRMDELKHQYETLQKSRHDFKNILCVIRSLNSERKHPQIEQYIASYLDTIQATAAFVSTDNEYLNAIISAKTSEARNHDIDVHIVITSQKQTSDHIDLCNMIGNMFDNAIAACLKLKEGRKITLRIYDDGSETIFCMKNTIAAPVLEYNPDLLTEKKDLRNHGYGTKIIREIAEKHNGFADFYEEGKLFCCNVVLHL